MGMLQIKIAKMKTSRGDLIDHPKTQALEISRTITSESFEVIWLNKEAHTKDALAIGGDEGRNSLRKTTGS